MQWCESGGTKFLCKKFAFFPQKNPVVGFRAEEISTVECIKSFLRVSAPFLESRILAELDRIKQYVCLWAALYNEGATFWVQTYNRFSWEEGKPNLSAQGNAEPWWLNFTNDRVLLSRAYQRLLNEASVLPSHPVFSFLQNKGTPSPGVMSVYPGVLIPSESVTAGSKPELHSLW